VPWEFSAEGHALSAPYLFCRNWFQRKALHGRDVLDFGCGARSLSIDILAGTGAGLTGVDISPESIRMASERARQTPGFEQSRFDVSDCEALPYEDDSFDYVLSLGTLSCVHLDRAYAEMRRVLREDGAVFIVDTLGHNPLFNLNRRLKLMCGLKMAWTVDHVRKIGDFELAGRYFGDVQMHFFDLLTPFLVPALSTLPGSSQRLRRWSWAADSFLLRSVPLGLRKHALKTACILTRSAK